MRSKRPGGEQFPTGLQQNRRAYAQSAVCQADNLVVCFEHSSLLFATTRCAWPVDLQLKVELLNHYPCVLLLRRRPHRSKLLNRTSLLSLTFLPSPLHAVRRVCFRNCASGPGLVLSLRGKELPSAPVPSPTWIATSLTYQTSSISAHNKTNPAEADLFLFTLHCLSLLHNAHILFKPVY